MTVADAPDEARQKVRKALMRWHSDKFETTFRDKVTPGDWESVPSRVAEVSKRLTYLMSAFEKRSR